MTPFQCDLCIFRCIHHRDPEDFIESDQKTLACIRRANLDAFWSRSPGTVEQNKYRVRRTIKDLKDELNISEAPFYDYGPLPLYDTEGYKVAFATLLASTRPGRREKTHSQWQTIRHIKGSVGTFERSSSFGLALVDNEKGLVQHFQDGGSSSLWYQCFAKGCKSRMGSRVMKNLALDVKLILEVLSLIEQKIKDNFDHEDSTERDKWIIGGAYVAFSYVLSLRGNECFMMDIKQLLENPLMEKDMVWIILSGVMKGQTTPMLHHLRSVPITDSGVNIKLWKERFMVVHQIAGRTEGPALCDNHGYLVKFIWRNLTFFLEISVLLLILDRQSTYTEHFGVHLTPKQSAWESRRRILK